MMSDPNGESPRCTAAINAWYGRGDIPIGVRRPGGGKANSKYARAVGEEFPHGFDFAAAPAAVDLYRRTLAGQPDGSVVIISIGTLENLAGLVGSAPDAHSPLGGRELVARKVRLWSCMGGHYPGPRKDAEHNFKFGGKTTAQAVNDWPTPILFSGWELGNRLITGATWPAADAVAPNPVRRAYQLYCAPGQGRQSWDQTSVLAAVRDPAKWWTVRRGGQNVVMEDGRNEWKASPDKDHAYLVEKAPPGEVVAAIEQLMMQPPKRPATRPAR